MVTFLGVVAGGSAAWWGFPPVALAAGQCNYYSYTQATRTYGFDYVDRGVKANTYDHVYGGGVQCAHVASVIVEDQFLNYVEVGWGTMQTAYSDCPDSGKTNSPVVLRVIKIAGQAPVCVFYQSIPIQGGDDPWVSVRSDNPTDPTAWIFVYNGNQLAYVQGIPFATGVGVSNTDRHYRDPDNPVHESSDAHFKGMQYRTGGNTWLNWGSEICVGSFFPDSKYHNRLTQPNEVLVAANSEICPP